MTSSKKDLITEAIKQVSKRKRALEFLANNPGFGWERWLQVELAMELRELGDLELEKPQKTDKRKKVTKRKATFKKSFIDLVFRRKSESRDKTVAIELKINKTHRGLIALLGDFQKISTTLPKEWEFRAVVGILCYLPGDENAKYTKYTKIKDDLIKLFKAREAKLGDYNVLVLGWERRRVKNMTRENYVRWYADLEKLYADHGVQRKISRPKKLTK